MENTITIPYEQFRELLVNDVKVKVLLQKYRNKKYSSDVAEMVRDLWELEEEA